MKNGNPNGGSGNNQKQINDIAKTVKRQIIEDINYTDKLADVLVQKWSDKLFQDKANDINITITTTAEKIAKETAKNEAEKIAKETAKNEAEKIAKETAKNEAKETATAEAKKTAEDVAEKKANTTVFTAFGVFATIVTVIISFVISSSTWLSSAGRTEAVFAFLIPGGVAVAVVLILLGVVFFRTDVVESGKINLGAIAFYIVIFAFAAVIMVLMYLSAYHLSKAAKTEISDHVRYIIQAGQYSIVDKVNDDQKDNTGQTIRYYIFTIDGEKKEIEKNDVKLHNNEIWYCASHDRIE